jgi:hypothetical protein
VGLTDRELVMRACRDDGVLLRPSWPLSALDVAYTTPPSSADAVAGALLWAAHDDHGDGAWRWSYVVTVNSPSAIDVFSANLQGAGPPGLHPPCMFASLCVCGGGGGGGSKQCTLPMHAELVPLQPLHVYPNTYPRMTLHQVTLWCGLWTLVVHL